MPEEPIVDREGYKHIRDNKDEYDPFDVGVTGFLNSFSGKWFSGYAHKYIDKGKERNKYRQMCNNLLNQLPNIMDVDFRHGCYLDAELIKGVYYLDPPYQNTTKYHSDFNHDEFWEFARKLSKSGNVVLISEENAPDDFECIWEQELNRGISTTRQKKKCVEKLFKYKG